MQVILAPGHVGRDLVELERQCQRTRSVQFVGEVAKRGKDAVSGGAPGLDVAPRADADHHVNVACVRITVGDPVVSSSLGPGADTAQRENAGIERRIVDSIDQGLYVQYLVEVR